MAKKKVIEDIIEDKIEETEIEEVAIEQILSSSTVRLDVCVCYPISMVSGVSRIEITNLGAGDLTIIEEDSNTVIVPEKTYESKKVTSIVLLATCMPLVKIIQYGS
jgi:hypothetical protein